MASQCTQLNARSALAKSTAQQLRIIGSPREHCSTSAQHQRVGQGWLGRAWTGDRAGARPAEVAVLPAWRPGSRLGVRAGRADGAAVVEWARGGHNGRDRRRGPSTLTFEPQRLASRKVQGLPKVTTGPAGKTCLEAVLGGSVLTDFTWARSTRERASEGGVRSTQPTERRAEGGFRLVGTRAHRGFGTRFGSAKGNFRARASPRALTSTHRNFRMPTHTFHAATCSRWYTERRLSARSAVFRNIRCAGSD